MKSACKDACDLASWPARERIRALNGSSLGRFAEVFYSQEVVSFVTRKCIHEYIR